MFLTNVAPLKRLPPGSPQVLSYFTSQVLGKGVLVLIPLRKKEAEAIVLSQKKVGEAKIEIKKSEFQLKPILKVIETEPIISPIQMELAKWISDYYFAPLSKTLRLFLPPALGEARLKRRRLKKKNDKSQEKTKLLSRPVRYLLSDGASEKYKTAFFDEKKPPALGEDRLKKRRLKLYLEPTGILPKEVETALKEKKHILFLVPEKQKKKFWLEKLKGVKNENLIIGTRSELFRHFDKLNLILITEEENSNYKSEREPKYQTKKVAEKMASLYGAELILLSSFPSPESYFLLSDSLQTSSEFKEMEEKILATEKTIIDMKKLKEWRPISPELTGAIEEELSTTQNIQLNKQGKILLFLNRRGEATTLICQDCGFVKKCKNCEAPMVYHKKVKSEKLKVKSLKENLKKDEWEMTCHHCGAESPVPEYCENCQSWKLITLGVGVEKVERELKNKFPKAKILRLDSQSTAKETSQLKTLKEFFEGKADILITTSLIFKYYPLPPVRIVGVVSLDARLSLPDFRAEEETARIISKLFLFLPKKFFLQTYLPESTGIKWIEGSIDFFLKETLKEREKFSYPPFSEIIKLTLSGKKQDKTAKEAYSLKKNLLSKIKNFDSEAEAIGPAPAFIPKIKGEYVWQMLLKLKVKSLKPALSEVEGLKVDLLSVVPPNWVVDVDPVRTL